ncbi:hypothetical protein K438DRAFT_1981559 [Mycena galopus ATCC 62051]|nr:hypothetical protein K438DRAFT_1981559 [Mycena galopus ATCC 62051]
MSNTFALLLPPSASFWALLPSVQMTHGDVAQCRLWTMQSCLIDISVLMITLFHWRYICCSFGALGAFYLVLVFEGNGGRGKWGSSGRRSAARRAVSGDKDKEDADGEEAKEGEHVCVIRTMERVMVPPPAAMEPVHQRCVLHGEERRVDIDIKAEDVPHLHVPSSGQLSPYVNISYSLHAQLDDIKESQYPL